MEEIHTNINNMTKNKITFSKSKKKKVEGLFKEINITQDGGLLIAKEIDKKYGFSKLVADTIKDKRNKHYIKHQTKEIIEQRVLGILGGYEDLNDHKEISKDDHFQTLIGKEERLASSSTLSRFENSISTNDIHKLLIKMIENFVDRHETRPNKIVLDFDPTDYLVHGEQEKRFYHGYYGGYCFLPMHVFSGDELVATLLKPSSGDGTKDTGAMLKLIVNRIRERWPDMRIVFRGDAGFARKHVLHWCENNKVEYVVGIGGNRVLQRRVEKEMKGMIFKQRESGVDQKRYLSLQYKAGTWKKERRVIAKLEASATGSNMRFLVTNNICDDAEDMYKNNYCPRGDMENKIKQLKLDLKGSRVSAHSFTANQYRNFISGIAYIILTTVRKKLLQGTELAKSYCSQIMLKLFKIGAIFIKRKTKITYLFSNNFPFKHLFCSAMEKLALE